MAKTMTIKDGAGQSVSEAKALAFFRREGQNLSEFMAEVKQLTPEAKTDLAVGVARHLGYTVEEATV